jgi:uncharacterized protein
MSRSEMILATKELYAAFGRRDIESILANLADDVVWCEPSNPFNPASGARHGRAGFLEWLRIGMDAEDILVLDPRQFLTGENSVAVVGYTQCRAKTTGRVYETDFVHLFTFRDRKIARFQEFFDTFVAGEAFR